MKKKQMEKMKTRNDKKIETAARKKPFTPALFGNNTSIVPFYINCNLCAALCCTSLLSLRIFVLGILFKLSKMQMHQFDITKRMFSALIGVPIRSKITGETYLK